MNAILKKYPSVEMMMKPDYTNIAHTASTQIHLELLETQTEYSF